VIGDRCCMGELVSAVLDGEATDLERAVVRRHLRSCVACREFHAFSRGTRVRTGEGLGPSGGASKGVGVPSDLSGKRLAAEVRRGRGGRTVRHATMTLMAVLAFGLILGVSGSHVLGERGPPGSVPSAHDARPALKRPLSPNFARLFETPPPARVVPLELAGAAEWHEQFVERASLEHYRSDSKVVRLAMQP